MTVPERLSALREKMAKIGADAVIIPSSDSHQSEYVAEYWQTRMWISGFTGSAGTAVVTADQAGVWTDSRYFIQAEEQLAGTGFELQKVLDRTQPGFIKWIGRQAPKGGKVVVDGRQFSESQFRSYSRKFSKHKIELVSDQDLFDGVWADRPAMPLENIYNHDIAFAGKSREDKLSEVRHHMEGLKVKHYLLAGLDDIAWLFNLRGADVECNPVFYAYAIVGLSSATLFTERSKLSEALTKVLAEANIQVKPYEDVLKAGVDLKDGQVLLQPALVNHSLYQSLPGDKVIEGPNIVRHLKAVKNETEIAHLKSVMKKDGVALLRLYRWLDAQLNQGQEVNEVEVAEQLIRFRSEQAHYVDESFPAIVGYKGNGAIVHYRAMPETAATVQKEGILLLDSGGQYIDGTTDITRTTSFGEVNEDAKTAYTLVLKGHIALANIQFPEGTNGAQLDALARMHLWNHGLNYGHGTGHGVGFFLNVHEPPQGFTATTKSRNGLTPFKPGMYTSNEPGYYQEGEFGIRIENLVICVEGAQTTSGRFLKFDTITLFPIETKMINKELMEAYEIAWLNDYHQKVYKELAPLVNEEEKSWLAKMCKAI